LPQDFRERIINESFWIFKIDYVIFAHGVCILSFLTFKNGGLLLRKQLPVGYTT